MQSWCPLWQPCPATASPYSAVLDGQSHLCVSEQLCRCQRCTIEPYAMRLCVLVRRAAQWQGRHDCVLQMMVAQRDLLAGQ